MKERGWVAVRKKERNEGEQISIIQLINTTQHGKQIVNNAIAQNVLQIVLTSY